jgi:hypothetical protein
MVHYIQNHQQNLLLENNYLRYQQHHFFHYQDLKFHHRLIRQ